MRENKFWLKWILHYSLGELLVIGVATLVGRLALIELSGFISRSPVLVTWLLLLTIGVAEGLTIGYLQWRSLTRLIVNFRSRSWILVTVAATTFGWLLVIPPSIFLMAFFVDFGLINKYYSVLYSVFAGTAFGGVIGLAQYLILRRFYHNAGVWIFSNVLGWMCSFMIVYFSMSILSAAHTPVYNGAVMVVACVVSGLIQGLITGTSLHFLMSVRKEYQPAVQQRPGVQV